MNQLNKPTFFLDSVKYIESSFLFRRRVMILSVVADDASSLALRVSQIKFEPQVSNFRATKANTWLQLLELQRIVSWLFLCCWDVREQNFSKVAKDASKPAVSWLKFEPEVSNFPFDKSQLLAFINLATGKIHGSFVWWDGGRKILFVVADDASSLVL